MRTPMNRSCCVLILSIASCLAPANVRAKDWPQWRGPNRDGKSADTGLLKEWPADGPKLAWKTTGLGKGFSNMSVAAGRLFTMGDKDDAGYVIALNPADGKILWATKVGAAGSTDPAEWNHPGPRCTPTVSGDLVFALNAWGEMICVTAADGKEQWRKNFGKDFGGKPPTWGYSESPLADGDQIYVTSGYNAGSQLFKVTPNAGKFSVEQVYNQRAMAVHHGGVVKVGDYLYGYSDSRGLACQNFQTGEIVWAEKDKIKKCCLSYADGSLYCREEESGAMVLLDATPSGYKEKGRFLQPDRAKEMAWPHPTIANGKLYLRDQDLLLCYDLK